MRYSINNEAIIFLDSDKDNNFHTIAYNNQNDDVVAIRPTEYKILKRIYDLDSVTENDLIATFKKDIPQKELQDILSKLVSNNIVIAYEQWF